MVGGIIQKMKTSGHYNEKGEHTNVVQSSSATSSTRTIITPDFLRPETDVLCGRTKAALNSIGNRTFRTSLALYIPRYEAARTKLEKSSVILYICNVFCHDFGVRFLKKYQYHRQQQQQQQQQHHHYSNGGVEAEATGKNCPKEDEDNYYYMELSGKEIKKKVGHALRDMSVARRQLLNEEQRLSVWTKTKTKTKTTPITATTAAPVIATVPTVLNTSTTTTNFHPTKQSQLPNDGNNPCTNTPIINIHTEEGRTKLLKLITFDDDIVVNDDDDEENKSLSVLDRSREFLPYVEYDCCSISNNNNNNNNNDNSNTHNNNPEDIELLEPISIHDTTAPF